MSCYLNFAIDLNIVNESVIYDKQKFIESPIKISHPEATKIVESLIENFQQLPVKSKDQSHEIMNVVHNTAYIYKLDKLSKLNLNETFLRESFEQIVQFFQKATKKINKDTLIYDDTGVILSGIQEVIYIRNYLTDIILKKNNKIYKEGYFYIFLSKKIVIN
ncbi:MAG: hypothetical protein AB4372_40755 [Xenococcus sp. (in: cyanobacteria)]